MQIKAKFDHVNIFIPNIERSVAFYRKALGLHVLHHFENSDGLLTMVMMGDDISNFMLVISLNKSENLTKDADKLKS